MALNGHSHAVEHGSRRMENNTGTVGTSGERRFLLLPSAHGCGAVSGWEADRQCFCGPSGELGIDERTGVETFSLELWEHQRLPTLPWVRRGEKVHMVPGYLLNGDWGLRWCG